MGIPPLCLELYANLLMAKVLGAAEPHAPNVVRRRYPFCRRSGHRRCAERCRLSGRKQLEAQTGRRDHISWLWLGGSRLPI